MAKAKGQRHPRRRAAELLEELKIKEDRLTNQVYRQNTNIVYYIGAALMKKVDFNFLDLDADAEKDLREMNSKGQAIIKNMEARLISLNQDM